MIKTGLSDFHKMTVTVMKTTFEKLKPNIIHYRGYRKFSNDKFREILIFCLSTEIIEVDCNGMGTLYYVRPWMNLHNRRKSIPEETICLL